MMDENKIVEEEIDVDVEQTTLKFPVRVKLACTSEQDCNFFTSINDIGQIVLTPRVDSVEFVSASTEWETDDYVTPQETLVVVDDTTHYVEKTIDITAVLLKEAENEDINADIDAIGQCVIYPADENNSFISASIEESLNLVTESEDETVETDSTIPHIEAEVLDEEIDTEYSYDEVLAELKQITHDFTDIEGTVKCGFESEKNHGVDILKQYYADVETTFANGWWYIEYDSRILTENTDVDRDEIINRFMRGEMPLFSDSGKPDATYIHLSELDHNNFCYFYDPESGCIVSYTDCEGYNA